MIGIIKKDGPAVRLDILSDAGAIPGKHRFVQASPGILRRTVLLLYLEDEQYLFMLEGNEYAEHDKKSDEKFYDHRTSGSDGNHCRSYGNGLGGLLIRQR